MICAAGSWLLRSRHGEQKRREPLTVRRLAVWHATDGVHTADAPDGRVVRDTRGAGLPASPCLPANTAARRLLAVVKTVRPVALVAVTPPHACSSPLIVYYAVFIVFDR